MKVTESIFKSFFEKKKLWNQKPNEFLSCQGRPDLGSLDKSSACLGSGDAGDFEVGWSSGKEREWSSWHAGSLKKHDEFQLFTHCSTAGPVQPVRKCLVNSWHKKRFGEKCESESEVMSSDTLALEMSKFAEDSLKVLGSPSQTKPEVEEICHVRKVVSRKGCIYAFSWSGTSLLCWPGFWHIWLIWARSEYPNCQQW